MTGRRDGVMITTLRWMGVVATIACAVVVLVMQQQSSASKKCYCPDDHDDDGTGVTMAGLLLVAAASAALDGKWSSSSSVAGVQQMGLGIVLAVVGGGNGNYNGSGDGGQLLLLMVRKGLGLVLFLAALLGEMVIWVGPYLSPNDDGGASGNGELAAEGQARRPSRNNFSSSNNTSGNGGGARREESSPPIADSDDWTSPLLSSSGSREESHYLLVDEERGCDPTTDPPPESPPQTADRPGERGEEGETESPSPPPRLTGLRRLLRLADGQVTALYIGCLVLAIRLPCSLAIPHLVGATLTAVGLGEYATARWHIYQLLIIGTVDAGLDFWGFFLFGYANQNIVYTLRTSLFRKLLGQEMAFFDRHESSALASRLSADCSEMAGDLTWFFRFSIESTVRICGIAIYMVVRSPMLAIACFAIGGPVAIINKYYGDWLRQNAIQVQDALAAANTVAHTALSNVRTVYAFCAESRECHHYEMSIRRQYDLNIQQLFWTALYYMGT
jgi:hypothetical protein